MGAVSSTFFKAAKLLSKAVLPSDVSTSNMFHSNCSTYSPTLGVVNLPNFSLSSKRAMVVFICLSLIINELFFFQSAYLLSMHGL